MPTPALCWLKRHLPDALFIISITLAGGFGGRYLRAQQVPATAPPIAAPAATDSTSKTASAHTPADEPAATLPDAPDQAAAPSGSSPQESSSSSTGAETDEQPPAYPVAQVVEQKDDRVPVTIETLAPQIKQGSHYTLDHDVVIHYGDRVIQADHIEYDSDTGDLTATGHLILTGGRNNEQIHASHGTFNTKTQTGEFYDVVGSVGLKAGTSKRVYDSGNPFLFTGKIVRQTGPQEYEIYDGTVTSCQLDKPDWMLSAGRFSVDADKARGTNSVFHLLRLPVFYLPYVTHPVNSEERQSGFMIPQIGDSSDKGITIGDEYYWAINRSSDLTFGTILYSLRGFYQLATYRYRGRGANFLTVSYNGLEDRGYTPPGGVFTYQGGQDVTFKGRYDQSDQTRFAADAEYLSSFIYREAFTANFNQAVSTDIFSILYAVHNADGYSTSFRGDRYLGVKPAPQTVAAIDAGVIPANSQITIFHVPSLALSSTDHRLGVGNLRNSGLEWSLDSSIGGLKRTQPGFTTRGVGRFDVHPEIAYPFGSGGWKVRPSVAMRETLYNRSQDGAAAVGSVPIESGHGLSRSDVEVALEMRAPVVERSFDSAWTRRVFGGTVRHTIEPEATYRYVTGISNFQHVLRFDQVDVASDTNELEYGVTQRLFVRRSAPAKGKKPAPCHVSEGRDQDSANMAENMAEQEPLRAVDATDRPMPMPGAATDGEQAKPCGSREFFSWRLAQKTFFDQQFGGAIVTGQRNVFDTTLALTGIAFLTEPRAISPLISRLRVRPSDKVDFAWDIDYDTGAKVVTMNNVFADVHEGNTFAGFSYARLDAPGRFYTQGLPSSTSNFSQMRLLLGYGMPTKPGLSVAGNVGLDLRLATIQYAALETSYNWNCCGVGFEVRKYELGAVRNENAYVFNFTLANIGTAGDLRRAERLF